MASSSKYLSNHLTGMKMASGGDQYIHNRRENSKRQHVLHECFRDTSLEAIRRSGITDAAFQADDYKILEIGCGTGLTTLDLARQMNKATITAIDTNGDLIADANERLKLPEYDALQPRIKFKVQNGESVIKEWESQFDAIWMRFVVVHVPDPVCLVNAALKYLKPNGIILIEDCNMEGFVSNPPLYACTLLHEAHIQVSIELGGDVRRGPLIGGYLKTTGFLDVQCNVFTPLFAKGVTIQPWCTYRQQQQQQQQQHAGDSDDRYELGFDLLRLSLDSLTPKFLETKFCSDKDMERAKRSLHEAETRDFQLFTLPGGQIFQWWARKSEDADSEMKRHTLMTDHHKRLEEIVDIVRHRMDSENFRASCKAKLDDDGVVVLDGFLKEAAIESVRLEGIQNQHLAYYTRSGHNVYLRPPNESFPVEHPRNREVLSSKGCIQTDQIPVNSALHTLYASSRFREFLCAVLDEKELHEYADSLSSINLHYAGEGQELNWHYDNSSFAITLLIQKPERGGVFEYVRNVRHADAGDMNYKLTGDILDGRIPTKTLEMNPGTLVLFRGRNSIHRVTPVEGDRTRILVVLAYNSKPGIALSESARMTFFGRLL